MSFLDSGSCTDVSLPCRDAQNIDQSEVRVSQPNFDDTGTLVDYLETSKM